MDVVHNILELFLSFYYGASSFPDHINNSKIPPYFGSGWLTPASFCYVLFQLLPETTHSSRKFHVNYQYLQANVRMVNLSHDGFLLCLLKQITR